MKIKLFTALFLAVFALAGCSPKTTSSEVAGDGSISIELPDISNTANRSGASDIALFVLRITSDAIEYSNTIESATGGIVTIEKLAEARYEITVDALDAAGDIILTGANKAHVYVGETTYAQVELNYIFGDLDIAIILPGDDFIARMEIDGIQLDNSSGITVVHGPGIYIDRVPAGSSAFLPGPSSTKVFSVETSGNNAAALQSWFDGLPNPRSGSLIVDDLAGNENYRWNMYDMFPLFYEVSSTAKTQFYFSVLRYELNGFSTLFATNYDQDADKGVEIDGVTPSTIAVNVVDNVDDQTLTLTFGYETGLSQLYDWTVNFMNGIPDKRSMSVITFGAGGFGDEVSRRNFHEVFVLSFEQINGFQLDIKGRFRVVLSYDFSEDA